jgi:ribosomal protein S18 acetylase RimI-like enzyme
MTDPDIRVEEATAVSGELVSTLRALVSQLSSASAPSEQELEAIVSSPATRLLVARDSGGAVIGTLTLVLFRIPTGMRAWIEDVVVDEAARGRGAGERLIRAALALAEANGARTVDLTSRPSREAANRLYEKLGFERRETNVYRFSSPAPPP